ncbi:hypothetical protein D0Y65_023136 [Glycine soja]|uniref:Uncharacterized protein n=1 Tax=Glycine soja TaxID=3848 RepID=A0A445IWM7_GLYSO|nr:hypothetical protein D0Y65_023136 [Glycine soja]
MSSAALRSSPPTPVTELSDESNANLSSLTTATSPSAASALSSPMQNTESYNQLTAIFFLVVVAFPIV